MGLQADITFGFRRRSQDLGCSFLMLWPVGPAQTTTAEYLTTATLEFAMSRVMFLACFLETWVMRAVAT